MDHLERLGLAVARECALHVQLADQLGEGVRGVVDAALPAGLDLLLPRQRPAVELEVGRHERRRQLVGGLVDGGPSQVAAEHAGIGARHQLLQRLEELRRPHVEVVHVRVPGGLEVLSPWQPRRELGEAGTVHPVVLPVQLTHRRAVARRPRELGLEGHHLRGVGGGGLGLLAEQREHAADVLLVVREQLLLGRVVADVVVAVGQADPTLRQVRDVGARVLEVRKHTEPEQRLDPLPVERSRDPEQRLHPVDPVDRIQNRPERADPGFLDTRFVHAGAEVVTNHPVGGVVSRAGGGLLDDPAQQVAVAFPDHRKAPHPLRLVGRQDRLGDPGSARVPVEVLARIRRPVHRRQDVSRDLLGGQRLALGSRGRRLLGRQPRRRTWWSRTGEHASIGSWSLRCLRPARRVDLNDWRAAATAALPLSTQPTTRSSVPAGAPVAGSAQPGRTSTVTCAIPRSSGIRLSTSDDSQICADCTETIAARYPGPIDHT